jgi:hypothetical protein
MAPNARLTPVERRDVELYVRAVASLGRRGGR